MYCIIDVWPGEDPGTAQQENGTMNLQATLSPEQVEAVKTVRAYLNGTKMTASKLGAKRLPRVGIFAIARTYVETYTGRFPFITSVRSTMAYTGDLTIAQAAGVVNTMIADLNRAEAAYAKLPAYLRK